MDATKRSRSRVRGVRVISFASLGSIACSLLAPPDDHFLSGAQGGSAGRSANAAGGANSAGGGATLGGKFAASGGLSGSAAGAAGVAGDGGLANGGATGIPRGGSTSTSQGGTSAATMGGEGGASGSNSNDSSEGGQGGAPATCSNTTCASNAHCVQANTSVRCVCNDGLVTDGTSCRPPTSCDELHGTSPSLPSGVYSIRPALASRASAMYCDMKESGGGWTLILNEGTDFMPKTPGTDDAICYDANCTSSAYASLPLSRDILLDVANSDITGQTYVARVRILGVNSASRGKTLRDMFTAGPYFLERGDNSNVTVTIKSGAACEDALPPDFATILCDTCSSTTEQCGKPILTLGDADSACNTSLLFAIGGSESESESWTNCAGWPQAANLIDTNSMLHQYYPTNMRIWVR